jgi:hypothetical protein
METVSPDAILSLVGLIGLKHFIFMAFSPALLLPS